MDRADLTTLVPCGCKVSCGDVSESQDRPLAVCKGLPFPRPEPLIRVELIDRRAE